MKHRILAVVLVLAVFPLTSLVLRAQPTGEGQLLTEENLNKLLPSSIFLDGENAPVQKRNAVGARMGNGRLLIVTLIDTSGYSSAYQEKYVGVLFTQGDLMFGKSEIKPGAYGLGRKKSMVGAEEWHTFVLYDIGGNTIAEIPAEKDEKLRPVKPIQLSVGALQPARLYLGRYFVAISSR